MAQAPVMLKTGTRVKILEGEYAGQVGAVINHTDVPDTCWHLVKFDEPMLKPEPGKEHEFNAGSGEHGWVLPHHLEEIRG